MWRGYCENCEFNFSLQIKALEDREGFEVSNSMLDFTFRLFELNRRQELAGDLNSPHFSDLEKEGLFILRDECKKFEISEMIKLRKK